MLAALLCRKRRGWAILFAVLTALISPVGAAFLGLFATVLVVHRSPGGWTLGISTVAPTVALTAFFPGGGIQRFSLAPAIPAVIAGVVVALLTQVPMVRTGALLYAGAVILFVLHSDPFGSNILRLGLLAAAPVLIATHRGWTPSLLVAVVALLAWQAGPLISDLGASPPGSIENPGRSQSTSRWPAAGVGSSTTETTDSSMRDR
jgi:hypothetical protein